MHNFFLIYYARIVNFIIFETDMEKSKSIDQELRATWQAVAKMYNEQASKYESTMAIALALLNIDKKNGTPSTSLGPLMGMEPTSFSRILKSMEDRGLIIREKNPNDGRGVLIKLTELGKKRREISKGHVRQFNNKVREHLTEEKIETFFEVTQTINKLIAEKEIYEDLSSKAV